MAYAIGKEQHVLYIVLYIPSEDAWHTIFQPFHDTNLKMKWSLHEQQSCIPFYLIQNHNKVAGL